MAITICSGLSRPNQQVQILRSAPIGHYYLQRAVTPDLVGSFAVWEHITTFFLSAEKPSEDRIAVYFWWIRKGEKPALCRWFRFAQLAKGKKFRP